MTLAELRSETTGAIKNLITVASVLCQFLWCLIARDLQVSKTAITNTVHISRKSLLFIECTMFTSRVTFVCYS